MWLTAPCWPSGFRRRWLVGLVAAWGSFQSPNLVGGNSIVSLNSFQQIDPITFCLCPFFGRPKALVGLRVWFPPALHIGTFAHRISFDEYDHCCTWISLDYERRNQKVLIIITVLSEMNFNQTWRSSQTLDLVCSGEINAKKKTRGSQFSPSPLVTN